MKSSTVKTIELVVVVVDGDGERSTSSTVKTVELVDGEWRWRIDQTSRKQYYVMYLYLYLYL